MEDIILYPGVQLEDFHAANKGMEFEEIRTSGGIQTAIGVANSSGSLYEKLKTEVINEEYDLIELNSDSDIEEDFHAVIKSIKYETKVQAEETETIRIAPSILPEIQKIPRAEESSQDEKFLHSLCRLCAIPCSDMIYIFGSTILHKSIIEKIQHCLPITVKKNDTLSKKVCRSCLQKLESCYRFQITVMEAEKQLLVFHEQTSGSLTDKTDIHCQTSRCNGQLDSIENADNEETSTSGSDPDANNIESNECSYLDKDNGTRDPNCEIQNTEPFMETLNSGRTSASETRQDDCDGTLNSPISKVHPEEGLRSDETVSDSANHSPVNIKKPSKPPLKTRISPSEKYSYSLRKRKAMEYNIDNDDGLSRDEVIDSQAPAAKKVRRQLIECYICKTTLQTIEECHTHARGHASTNYYPCCFCNKVLDTEPHWKEHWSQHGGNAHSPKFKRKALPYRCTKCGKNYAGKVTLEKRKLYHQREVSNHEPHCQTWDKTSNPETSAQQHMIGVRKKCETSCGGISATQFRDAKESNHQEKPVFQYNCCKKKIASNISSERNKKFCSENRNKYVCDYCKKVFDEKHHLVRHMPSHTGKRPSSFSCDICPKTFTTKYKRNDHLRIHTGERPFSCDICSKAFTTKYQRDVHLRIHTGERPSRFSCDICPKTFTSKYRRNYHLRIHTGERPFSCDICPKAFTTKYEKGIHHRIHTGERPFSCDSCSQSFTTKQQRDRHCIIHTGTRPFICDICSKAFTTKYSRDSHLRIHTGERPFSCDICSKAFTTKYSRDSHLRIHTGERPFSCDICPKAFTTKYKRNDHHRIHTGERPFSCDICSKTFTTKYKRNDHHRIHTGERPFSCDICPRAFRSKYHRDTHLRIHTGKRPFSCDSCSQSFTTKQQRDRHCIIHTGTRPFICDICSKSFVTKECRDNHHRLHTGERPYQCSICEVGFHSTKALSGHKRNVHS